MKSLLLLPSFCFFTLIHALPQIGEWPGRKPANVTISPGVYEPSGPVVQVVTPKALAGSAKDKSNPALQAPVQDYFARVLFEAENGSSYVADVPTRWSGRGRRDKIATKVKLDAKVKSLQIIKVADHSGIGSRFTATKPGKVMCEALDENLRYLTQMNRFGIVTQHATRFIFEAKFITQMHNQPLTLDAPAKVSTLTCWESVVN